MSIGARPKNDNRKRLNRSSETLASPSPRSPASPQAMNMRWKILIRNRRKPSVNTGALIASIHRCRIFIHHPARAYGTSTCRPLHGKVPGLARCMTITKISTTSSPGSDPDAFWLILNALFPYFPIGTEFTSKSGYSRVLVVLCRSSISLRQHSLGQYRLTYKSKKTLSEWESNQLRGTIHEP